MKSYSEELSNHLLDIGKRASDIVNIYITGMDFEEIKHRYIAIRLRDGGTDGVLYDSKQDAIKHQPHERQCAYVCLINLASGSSPRDMAIYLKMNRDAYYRGLRLTDPDDPTGGPDVLATSRIRDYYNRMIRPNNV
jgi:hypothetical protein